jgi:hypothetical protein
MTNQSSPASTLGRTVVLGVVISALALALLFQFIDTQLLLKTLGGANLPRLLIAVGVIYPLAMVARGWRWWWLLHQTIHWRTSWHILNVGYLANMIFPARLGEVVRLFLVRNQPQGSGGQALSAIAVERLLDLLLALLMVALGLFLLGDASRLPGEALTSLGILLVIAVFGFAILILAPPAHPFAVQVVHRLSGRFLPRWQNRLTALVQRTLDSLRILASPLYLLTGAGWTGLTWVLYCTTYHLILWAFVDTPPLGASLLATGLIALSIGVPSVPSYAGPYHVGAALALSMYGYNETTGASFALTAHGLLTILTIGAGVVSMQALHINLGNLRRLSRRG